MNLFTYYQEKIFKFLKNLAKKNIIQIPSNIKSFNVELPPKNQKADMSCNAAMILAKINNSSPNELAKIMGYRTTEKNRSPGYKQIKNIKKSIIKKVKKLLDKGDIDLF